VPRLKDTTRSIARDAEAWRFPDRADQQKAEI
jgi:hypothetical protein